MRYRLSRLWFSWLCWPFRALEYALTRHAPISSWLRIEYGVFDPELWWPILDRTPMLHQLLGRPK